VNGRTVEAIPADDLRTIITAARTRGGKLATLVEILPATGCRRGEALGLQWADVDQVAGTLRIRRSWTQSGIVENTKTDAGTRTVAAPACLVSATPGAPDALVVGFSPNAADKAWRTMLADLGFAGQFHMHMIRHSVASRMIADGVPITNVSAQLGHANPSITLGIYSHATEDHTPAAVEW